MIVYDKTGDEVSLVETKMIGDDTNKFLHFDIYNEFNKLTNPYEGLKNIYERIPNSYYPRFVSLYCGAQYIAIVQKTTDTYGSAIIIGYSLSSLLYCWKATEWYSKTI